MTDTNHNIAYNLSYDYKKLYQFVCSGFVIVGFVDYKDKIGNEEYFFRDVCQIRKLGEFEIHFFSRGKNYGSIDQNLRDWKKGITEEELFCLVCKTHNLGFIDLPEDQS